MTFNPYMKPKESDVQKAVRGLLRTCGIWHFRHQSSMGSHPGVYDLIGACDSKNLCPHCGSQLIVPGRFLAIETKRPGRDTTDPKRKTAQDNFRDEVIAAGGIAFVARSVEDVVEGLDLTQVNLGPVFGGKS